MYQHVFWFYSHPAVYIMMLPGFGIISEVISTHARKPIFGYRMMAFSLVAIVILGFTVWAHHMFVSGMQSWIRIPMMITTMLIAVPTGIKIFSWLATLWRGVIHLRTPMLFALGFITMFTLGGISGIMLAVVPFDIHVSDTYFIVAHIHYVLFGGSVFTIFAGIYHWFPKMTGRMYDEGLGRLHFWMSFIFFNLTFGPMHLVGIDGMPRRVADYAEQYATWNAIISISAFIFGASFLIFLYNMIASWRHGPAAVGNPWRAQLDRVAGVLAAAGVQLRRGADRGRRAVRVRRARARSTPSSRRRRPQAQAPCRRRPAGAAHHRRLTDEAHPRSGQRDGGRQAADRRRSASGPRGEEVEAHVISPQNQPQHGYVIYDEHVRDAAENRLEMTLALLREAGIEADGEVMDPDPYSAVMDALGEQDYDEIVISTHPETRSGWLREGLVDRVGARRPAPVEHVVVDLDAERDDMKRTLVVANQTVARPSCSRCCKKKAERGAAPLHRDRAAGRVGRRRRRRRRTSGSRRRSRRWRTPGSTAIGQVEHPDPYTAIQNALQFYAPDDIVISTFPETRSGWLRGDLIGRVEASTGKPVEHVVSEEAPDGIGIDRRPHRPRASTTGRPRPTSRRGSRPSSSGCCFSSSPR